MKRSPEQRRLRQTAWLLVSANTSVLVLVASALGNSIMALLPIMLLSAMLAWRLPAGALAQSALSMAAVVLGFLAAGRLDLPGFGGVLGALAGEIMLACLLLIVLRCWLKAPCGGMQGNLALGLSTMAVAGGAPLGPLYPLLCALYTGLSLLALRESQAERAAAQGWRQWPAAAGLLLLAVPLGLLIAATLPGLYERGTGLIAGMLKEEASRIRFTDSALRLGSLSWAWQSDDTVLRVDAGLSDPLLRGSVHRRYQTGQWLREPPGPLAHPQPLSVAAAEPKTLSVSRLDETSGPLFLPLGAAPAANNEEPIRQDVLGVARVLRDKPTARYQFIEGRMQVSPPDGTDLLVPQELKTALRTIALDWTRDAVDDATAIRQLQFELEQKYVYSLSFERRANIDPVLDFLTSPQPQGHCEYFASALALLARSIDIPSRVIRGYRASERNPWLGHYIVRERHAHAWTEIWLNGRWQSHDPNPVNSVAPAASVRFRWLSTLLDSLSVLLSRFWQSLDSLPLIGLAGLLMAALALPRLRQQRWSWPPPLRLRGRRQGGAHNQFQRLESALAQVQCPRPAGQSLEAFAKGLRAQAQPLIAHEAAALVERYAAFRYGAQGSARPLSQAIEDLNRRLTQEKLNITELSGGK